MEKAIFGAGCFWHIQDRFKKVKGVSSTSVGYSGGKKDSPTYEQVCTGDTGHAEVVEVDFDPSVVTYSELLDVFWSCHDPTTKDRQGPDIGHQYRSVIYYLDDRQKKLAEESMNDMSESGRFRDSIVTEIYPIKEYYKAEDYHQDYFDKKGSLFGLM
ncbi:MAG: peptide-methionine (S)-S-oxide reductase MsrA [Nitrososphaerales archaeon]|tara:strand:- start:783 stop:1253 length:471 start_codon:yes stop_codon:yes gene_type:complete